MPTSISNNALHLACHVGFVAVVLALAGCGGGGGGGSSTPPPPTTVSISGKVNYEFVPPNANCAGLNFDPVAIQLRPIRGATVQLLDSTNAVLGTTVASDTGDYSFAGIATNTMVHLRVKAEAKRTGSPAWDVEVRDNYLQGEFDDDVPAPPTLATRALYVLDGSAFSTGTADVSRTLTATTGWTGTSYSNPRAAAPFAILDTIYTAMQFVVSAEANTQFPPLDVFWSVNNAISSGSTDITAGELPTSFYQSDIDSLFLIGDASSDTEEFDDHVIAHEWGHYFEDSFSRSDSIGGSHALGESIDARLAFSEGWATALSAMALNNPQYCDTGEPGTSDGFGLNTETSSVGVQGWFNELSIVTLLYDLWDTGVDGTDTGSLGFAPIFAAMAGPQANTSAFTTIFSFASELRSSLAPADATFLDSQLTRENISPLGIDSFASTEINDAGGGDVLSLYTDVPVDAGPVDICVNNHFDNSGRDGNKLAEYRYVTFNVPATSKYSIDITTTTNLPADDPNDDHDQSDPDMYFYRNGVILAEGITGEANHEAFTTPVLTGPGLYIADLTDYRFADLDSPAAYPDRICFDVSISTTP